MTSRFRLGERVRFTSIVEKFQERPEEGFSTFTDYRPAGLPKLNSWKDETIDEGIVVGQRTLQRTQSYQESDYSEYDMRSYSYTVIETVPNSSRRAWLVQFHLRRKPVLVLDEDIVSLEEDQ